MTFLEQLDAMERGWLRPPEDWQEEPEDDEELPPSDCGGVYADFLDAMDPDW